MLMIQSRIKLCDVFGIPLYLDFSLIFLLLVFVLNSGFDTGLVCAALLLFSITAHELGHALTARAFGYSTRDITLSLLGGCASLIALPKKSWQEFLTALAGPAVSFALAALGAFGIMCASISGDFLDVFGMIVSDLLNSFGLDVSWGSGFVYERSHAVLISSLCYLSYMNLMLGFFNLLPGFPMDGGRIFRSAMRPFMSNVRATYIAMVVGRAFAVLLGLKGIWNILNGRSWGFVTIMIAWMIWKEGFREYLMAKFESVWDPSNYRAHASPPPYGGKDSESDLDRGWPHR